ncbi:AI-2E family transporter [Algoriphagus litoralis]|uniref:AI-2E family transporter n=1 Tax=Algoriphagus litoralis TaxID=2202829 RepID=UPI000DB9D83E|nr:AI-2E family transporter [Algoriphagus litoralis]
MNRIQNIAYFLIILVLGAIILIEGSFILVPLVWGIFFAVALNPISSWLERKRIPRGLAVFTSILMVSLVSLGIFYLLVNQMLGLIKEIPEIGNNLESKLSRYLQELSQLVGIDLAMPVQGISFFPEGDFNKTLIETGKSLTLAGIVPLYTFLLIYYKDFFMEFLVRISTQNKDQILTWAEDSGRVIQSYLVGLIRVTGIVAILAGTFFYFLGVNYFILFAAFIAILNLIPYVGVFISSFFVILYVFLTTDSLVYPIVTFAVLWGIQLLENNIITPLVVGSKVKVNALAVILAILLGGWLWGISGMVLFIPLVGVLKITLEKNPDLSPYAYLLGDEIPVTEEKENFFRLFQNRFFKK